MQKNKVGRPPIPDHKREPAKQCNVMVPESISKNPEFIKEIKYQSFSQFVLGLIRHKLNIE